MFTEILAPKIKDAIKELFNTEVDLNQINVEKTRKEIEGDYTVNVFPFVKFARKSPEETAKLIGDYVVSNLSEISDYNVIKGFLNFNLNENYWIENFNKHYKNESFGLKDIDESQAPVLVEYSSPNTNKPLHLGHVRNNLLGFSIAQILKANGQNVKMVNLVNDRGIHICKSMLAWERWAKGATPETENKKGDHFVGDYYVMFDQAYKTEVKRMVDNGTIESEAEKKSVLMKDARRILKFWEDGDDYITKMWMKLNDWVCTGFEETYNKMGIYFDKVYYESDTYLLGKDIVKKGLEEGRLEEQADGSVWADLTDKGLDKKLLLRSDGTSVYMTQDLGTADLRVKEFEPSKMLYVVGDEQNYHFQVLKLILDKLGYDISKNIEHISYGMVELPDGKMKSREGNVVDADDLIDEMIKTAKELSSELGKANSLSEEDANELYRKIGLGALKYYILKVDPKKKMMFNPKESIDFNGNTGSFIQYSYVRIMSILKKAELENANLVCDDCELEEKEKSLLKLLLDFPETLDAAAETYSPSIIANYCYDLAKEFNQFYHEFSILKAENKDIMNYRLALCQFTANVLKNAMALLGIEMPEQM